jgi:hypothetical protein
MFLTLIILHNHQPAPSARHINMLSWQDSRSGHGMSFIFCSSSSFKLNNIVQHVYCCVAAVSSADCLVKPCSVLALDATVTESLGYFFIACVESNYKISFAPHFCDFLPFSAL